MAQRRGLDQCEPRRSPPRGGGQRDWGGALRGSTSRRGLGVLKDMKRSIRDGFDVGVTADGPRGPRYELKAGLLKLAQLTRPPLMCFHAIFGCAIRVGTWDRFVIPLSFSKVTIVFDELLDVSCDLDDDAFEARRVEAENLMRWSGRSGPACK
jgi:lysophospholipid acyltransferase (LPLAT)-like uncharacterized protein